MLTRIRAQLTYANVMVTLLAVVVLGGGAAYAAGTIVSSDIVDDEVRTADVRDDTLTGGGLRSVDLRSGSVGPAEAANLTGADIADAASGSDNVNADKLDGLSSSGLVKGRGRFLAARFILTREEEQRMLLTIPGLGQLDALCDIVVGRVTWSNTTNDHVDFWIEADGEWSHAVVPPFGTRLVADSAGNTASTFAIGFGDDSGARRTVTMGAFVSRYDPVSGPCAVQAQGTLWTTN